MLPLRCHYTGFCLIFGLFFALESSFRSQLVALLPRLRVLDEVPVTSTERNNQGTAGDMLEGGDSEGLDQSSVSLQPMSGLQEAIQGVNVATGTLAGGGVDQERATKVLSRTQQLLREAQSSRAFANARWQQRQEQQQQQLLQEQRRQEQQPQQRQQYPQRISGIGTRPGDAGGEHGNMPQPQKGDARPETETPNAEKGGNAVNTFSAAGISAVWKARAVSKDRKIHELQRQVR